MRQRLSQIAEITLAVLGGVLLALLVPQSLSAQAVLLANSGNPTHLYHVDLDPNEATLLLNFQYSFSVRAIALCPGDTNLLGIGTYPPSVSLVDLTTSAPTEELQGQLPAAFRGRVYQAACSPDGTYFFTNVENERLYALDLATCDPGPCTPELVGTIRTIDANGEEQILDTHAADIEFVSSGEMYLLTIRSKTPTSIRSLYRVDPGTAVATFIGEVSTARDNTGLAETDDGRLILSSHDDNLYEIDPRTGDVTSLGTVAVLNDQLRYLRTLNIAGGDMAGHAPPLGLDCPPSIDFETDYTLANPLRAGDIIDDANQPWGPAGIFLSTDDPANQPLMIFDSGSPTGGDHDLGTPNELFTIPPDFITRGPGIGDSGNSNQLPRGKVLILSEDGNSGDPNDADDGGLIAFDFVPPVEITEVRILDIDKDEGGGTVTAYDDSGAVIVSRSLVPLGDNSFQTVELFAPGVQRLEIWLAGSGALSEVILCDDVCVFVPEPPDSDCVDEAIYAVDDIAGRSSQFFTLDGTAVMDCGPVQEAYNIEGLEGHNGVLYGSSGDVSSEIPGVRMSGALYTVDGDDCELHFIGETGFSDIEGLAFHPSGVLFGIDESAGVVAIDTSTGAATWVAPDDGNKMEAITWSHDGEVLFGSGENEGTSPRTSTLYAYLCTSGSLTTGDCAGGGWVTVSNMLPGEVEGLETAANGDLIVGVHSDSGDAMIYYWSLDTSAPYNEVVTQNHSDVEGLAQCL
jgi:WD40 repeat protein